MQQDSLDKACVFQITAMGRPTQARCSVAVRDFRAGRIDRRSVTQQLGLETSISSLEIAWRNTVGGGNRGVWAARRVAPAA